MSSIKVNTVSLNEYAQRISNVNKRIVNLDFRMDKLYRNAGLLDLFRILRNDLLIGYSVRLKKSQNYLVYTAQIFLDIEKELASYNPLDFKKPSIVKITLDKQWKDFTESWNKLDDLRKKLANNISKEAEAFFLNAKNALSEGWDNIEEFFEEHTGLNMAAKALWDIGSDAIGLITSVGSMKSPLDIATGVWDLINFVPTAGCDLMALAIPGIGAIFGKSDEWVEEQSTNFRNIDSWADFIAYQDAGYETPDDSKKSKVVKTLEKIDYANDIISTGKDFFDIGKGAFDTAGNISDIHQTKKGIDIIENGEIQNLASLKKELKENLKGTFGIFKDSSEDTLARAKNVKTIMGLTKDAAEGKLDEAIGKLTKPGKLGVDIGKLIVDYDELTEDAT